MTHLSEEILIEILARLPLRIICRFKLLSKSWKSTLQSPYFRHLFVSLHKNSSSSWSLLSLDYSEVMGSLELVGFHGCETWDFPKSIFSCIRPSLKPMELKLVSFSNGLVLIEQAVAFGWFFVGNPVLKQWVKIPPFSAYGIFFHLVTRVDEDGVVLSFKVVGLALLKSSNHGSNSTFSIGMYSSETGVWTRKTIHYPSKLESYSTMALDSTIYFSKTYKPRVLIAHDYYSESDHFRVLHYPDLSDNNPNFKRALLTSGGFVVYLRTLAQKEETDIKVWRLNTDDSWQLLWEISIPVIGEYVPVTMHPFDSGIMYLWNLQNRHMVSCNLQTQNYIILRDGCNEDCVIEQSTCDKYINKMWETRRGVTDQLIKGVLFVLPRWMESMPCPPQVEMVDTTSMP